MQGEVYFDVDLVPPSHQRADLAPRLLDVDLEYLLGVLANGDG